MLRVMGDLYKSTQMNAVFINLLMEEKLGLKKLFANKDAGAGRFNN